MKINIKINLENIVKTIDIVKHLFYTAGAQEICALQNKFT